MSERDPRFDPRPGDVLRKGSSTIEVQCASIVGLSFKLDGLLSESPPMMAWCEPSVSESVHFARMRYMDNLREALRDYRAGKEGASNE